MNSVRKLVFAPGCIQSRSCDKNTCPTDVTIDHKARRVRPRGCGRSGRHRALRVCRIRRRLTHALDWPAPGMHEAGFEGYLAFSRAGQRTRLCRCSIKKGHDMALELRPNCECCDRDLPSNSTLARICSFECTFCAECVENILLNVCPNCGGGFERRPIRPATEWRSGISVAKRPPSDRRVHLSFSLEEIAAHSARIKAIASDER
jgi:hypothetical protein